jgi:hypothetical protein
MKLLSLLRYVLFAVFGVVIAAALFFVLNVLVSANYDAGTGFIERWIIRATCSRYELEGVVRDTNGRPVPFAIIEATYFDTSLTTRSNGDGTFLVTAEEPVCDRQAPQSVAVLVMAEDFRPKRQTVPFEQDSLEVLLDPRDFRP